MNNYASKEKIERLRVIRYLIQAKRITSQDELLGYIQQRGFHTTQATLSRDLKYLKATKQYDDLQQTYIYVLPENYASPGKDVRFALDEFISIDFSHNLAIVKTSSGFANAIAIYFDRIYIDEIVGTVAGDDTILVVLREGVTHRHFLDALLYQIPELKEKINIEPPEFDE